MLVIFWPSGGATWKTCESAKNKSLQGSETFKFNTVQCASHKLLKNIYGASSGLKRRGTIHISAQLKSLHVWWECCHMAYVATHGATYAPIQMRLFFLGNPCIFQQDNDNDKPHTASIPAGWLHSRRVQVLDWPPCRPDLSLTENILNIFKQEMWQKRKCPNATMTIKGCQNYENLLVFLADTC